MSFTDKVVIVTGASSGIGAATAVLFAKEGASVVMVGRNETKLKNVAEQCEKNGSKPLMVNADVSKDADAKRIIEATIEKFGKIDILVNNAGIIRYGSIVGGKLLESFDEVMSTNLRSVVNLTSLATPYLIKTRGNIVNVSSTASTSMPPSSEMICYGASKAGLNHFSRSAALELSAYGIRVNVVSPGPVKTDIVENSGISMSIEDQENSVQALVALNRISESEEIGDVILFLASEKAKAITGSVFVNDNGYLIKNS